MDELCAAGARKPDVAAVPATVQIAAALVLSDKGHENVRHVRHGTGRQPQTRLASRAMEAPDESLQHL
jgi:hypothetical protein